MIGRTRQGWRHGRLVVFVLLNVARRLKMFARLFRIKQAKATKKVKYALFTRKKTVKPTHRVTDDLEMPSG